MLRRCLRAGATLLWSLVALTALAQPLRAQPEPPLIQVLLSEPGRAYEEVAQHLQDRLEELIPQGARLEIRTLPETRAEFETLLRARPAILVPVGVRATSVTLQRAGTVPVLSLLVPQSDYTALVNSQSVVQANLSGRRSAIFLDQPLERQLNLLHLVVPEASRLATLAGPHSAARVEELATLSRQRGLTLFTQNVERGANPVPSLTRLLDQAEVLLALPDPDIFNRSSLQAILLTTYRNDIPVIGFSRAYVRAGAMAAVHSTAEHIGRQAGEWLADMVLSNRWTLNETRFPVYYSVSVNDQVAQSLGMVIPNENTLLHQLMELETRRQ